MHLPCPRQSCQLLALILLTFSCSSCEEKSRLQANTAAIKAETDQLKFRIALADEEADGLEARRELHRREQVATAAEAADDMASLLNTKATLEQEIASIRKDMENYRQRHLDITHQP